MEVKTTSLSFPNMFNISQNEVSVLQNESSVVNRSRLLILTEPTEVYNEPNQGVGLKRHLWHYNNKTEESIIRDRIKEQLRLHEPQVNPDGTQFSEGLLFTGTTSDIASQHYNELNMTVSLETKFGKVVDLELELYDSHKRPIE